MVLRYNIIILLSFLSLCQLQAQKKALSYYPVIEYHHQIGRVLPHADAVRMTDNGNVCWGNELRLGLQTTGSQQWHIDYNYPCYGLGFYWSDFNNPIIGSPSALFSYIEFPFVRTDRFLLSLDCACGLSFNINEYDKNQASPNLAIGSDRNAYIAFTTKCDYKVNPYLSLGLGAKLQHFSNGCIHRPNFGLNVAMAEISATYHIKGDVPFASEAPQVSYKRYEYSLMYAGGFVDVFDDSDETHYCSVLSLAVHRRLNAKRSLGLGFDSFYSSYLKIDTEMPDDPSLSQLMSYAAFASSELIVDKVHVVVQVGVYLWRAYPYDIPFYERLGLRYYFLKNRAFANVSVKAHDIRALYTEWGIGLNL